MRKKKDEPNATALVKFFDMTLTMLFLADMIMDPMTPAVVEAAMDLEEEKRRAALAYVEYRQRELLKVLASANKKKDVSGG